MANEQSLISGEETLTAKEQTEGNKAGEETERLRNALKKALEESIPEDMTELRELLGKADIDTTNDNGIAFAVVLKALKGDLSAARWIKDTVEEKSTAEAEASSNAVVIISGDDEIAE